MTDMANKERPHYENAPITEALITIGFFPEEFGEDQAARVQKLAVLEFPGSHFQLESWIGNSPIREDASGTTPIEDSGKVVPYSVTVGKGSFSFSRLQPYDTWEDLRQHALSFWNRFVDEFTITKITQLSIRTVNRIPVNVSQDRKANLTDFVQLFPVWNLHAMPWTMNDFFLNVHLTVPDKGIAVRIREGTVSPKDGLGPTILFDTDVVTRHGLPEHPKDVDAIIARLEVLHQVRNQAFEATITDLVREMIA